MISIQNLTVDYGDGAVLDDLSLTLESRMVHGFVGRNGEGKTTLLNAIYGTLIPGAGSVSIDGHSTVSEKMAYLETELYFYPMITGKEYLLLFKSRNPEFDLEGWNALFDLPLKEYISSYSTGMKKKLALMAVLSLDREIVMLDEPFNGLDLESNLFLGMILRKLAEANKTVIVTSHILESLLSICDRIHLLRGGRIERSYEASAFHELRDDLMSQMQQEKLPALNELFATDR